MVKIKIGEYIWNLKYRHRKESWDEFINRVSHPFKRLAWFIDQKVFIPAGRILATRGTSKLTTMLNCFMSSRIPDSIAGIMDVAKESALIMKLGGGIGFNFSTIRPKDSLVKTSGGRASGVVSFMHIFDSVCATIKSANNRRGAQMGMLRVDHPDILDFITAKRKKGELTNFNLSVQMTEDFLSDKEDFTLRFKDMEKEIKKQEIWDKFIENSYEFSEPGVFFIDTANKADNLYYYQEKAPQHSVIQGTNPCITGDALIMTESGLRQVEELVDQPFYAMVNGKKYFVEEGFFYTGIKRVRRIKTKEGFNLKVTPDHKFRVKRGKSYYWVEAKDLKKGDKLVLNDMRSYFNSKNTKIEMRQYYKGIAFAESTMSKKKWTHTISRLTQIMTYSFCKAVADWILVQPAPRVAYSSKKYKNILSEEIIDKLQLLFLSGGLFTQKRTYMRQLVAVPDKGEFLATYDGFTTIGEEPVYDAKVPTVHMYSANGFLVHNCGEVPLPNNGVCCLGSVNLAKLVDNPFEDNARFKWATFEEVVGLAIEYLDNILDETVYPNKTFENTAKYTRRIGLGITGYADALIMMGMKYGSVKALEFTEKLMKTMKEISIRKSIGLASVKGIAPIFKDYGVDDLLRSKYFSDIDDDIKRDIKKFGIRNSHRLSIAPTGTISLFAGNVSSSIEPLFSIEPYQRKIKVEGKETEDVIDVEDYAYSVYKEKFGKAPKQGGVWLTAEDIHWQDHIKTQATFQKYVDLSISKTINLSEDFKKEDIKDLVYLANDYQLKGLTIFRPNPDVYDTPIIKDSVDKRNNQIVIYGHNIELSNGQKPAILVKYKPSQAIYPYWITISLQENDGIILPYQIFLNTKNQDANYMQLLGRLLTAISIRSNENKDTEYLELALEELRATRVPHETFYYNGEFYASYVAGMADIIREIVNKFNTEDELFIDLKMEYVPCPKCGRLGIPKNGCGNCIYCGYHSCSD